MLERFHFLIGMVALGILGRCVLLASGFWDFGSFGLGYFAVERNPACPNLNAFIVYGKEP